ncbi:MAG TPA: hypothetical protein VMT53_24640 [Terriglobales bacterium]|nr:hypothetical protein [Terriglobales bacterium]
MKKACRLALPTLILLTLCTHLFAARSPDRTQFGRDIHITAGERTADVTCFYCSIYFSGKAAGDVTAVHGNVVIESGAEVAGDVTAIGGYVRSEGGTQILGDLTAIGGSARRDPQSTISGAVTSLAGSKWLLALIVPPLVFLGGIIALIIWLLQRNRRSAPAPVYAQTTTQTTTRA